MITFTYKIIRISFFSFDEMRPNGWSIFVGFILITFDVVDEGSRGESPKSGLLDIVRFIGIGVGVDIRVILDLIVDSTTLFT